MWLQFPNVFKWNQKTYQTNWIAYFSNVANNLLLNELILSRLIYVFLTESNDEQRFAFTTLTFTNCFWRWQYETDSKALSDIELVWLWLPASYHQLWLKFRTIISGVTWVNPKFSTMTAQSTSLERNIFKPLFGLVIWYL